MNVRKMQHKVWYLRVGGWRNCSSTEIRMLMSRHTWITLAEAGPTKEKRKETKKNLESIIETKRTYNININKPV